MIRKAAIVEVLNVLGQSRGFKFPQKTLGTHVNINLAEPLSHEEFTDHLQFAQRKNWIRCETDEYGEKRWWITDSGEIERSRYQ